MQLQTADHAATEKAKNEPPDNSLLDQKRLLSASSEVPLILDIGAHKGGTLRRYRKVFPEATLHCFEPFPDSFVELKALAETFDNVHCHPLAVSEAAGERTFHVNHFEATNSLLPRPVSSRRYFPSKATKKTEITVPVTTVDGFLGENSISRVSVLKLDIQGAELMALKGSSQALSDGKISMVYCEAMFVPHYEGNPLLWEVWQFLQGFGYTLYQLYDLVSAKNGQLRYGDALFVSPALRASVIDSGLAEP